MPKPPFSHAARVSIALGTGLAFANAVSTVFVSMYLYRWLDSIAELTVFNLGQFILMPLGFALAAIVARRFGNRSAMALGLTLFIGFYGLLVALGEGSSRHLVALGIINGLANGFFWFPYNIITARAAEASDKGRFFGLSGALGSAAMAAGPLVSTLAISLAPLPETGYSILFLSIVAVMTGMAVAALSLPNDAAGFRLEVMRHLRSRGDGRWSFALKVNLVAGLRDGANWSVMSILILQGAGSETVAGYLAIIFAALGIGANYLVGKLLAPRRYSALWALGSAAATVSALVIALWPTLAGAAISGTLWKASEALVYLPFNAAFLGLLAGYIRKEGNAAGRNIAAEIALNVGRAISAGSFLVLSFYTADYAKILFPLLTLAVPGTWLIYRRYAVLLNDPLA